jgi:hypothetical protein
MIRIQQCPNLRILSISPSEPMFPLIYIPVIASVLLFLGLVVAMGDLVVVGGEIGRTVGGEQDERGGDRVAGRLQPVGERGRESARRQEVVAAKRF